MNASPSARLDETARQAAPLAGAAPARPRNVLTLPASAATRGAGHDSPDVAHGPARVLVVEDDKLSADLLEHSLRKLGYGTCGSVSSGRAALARAFATRPDVVLMDIGIEGEMDGIEAGSHLRWTAGVPVIYLSAHCDDATLARARPTRPYGFLIKPYTDRELHAALQIALERARAEAQVEQSESRLRLALDASRLGIWEFDAAADRLDYDPRAAELLGLPPLGHGPSNALLDRILPADRSELAGALLQVLNADKPFTLDCRGIETLTWLRLRGRPQAERPGMPRPRVIGVVEDITEQCARNALLREADVVLQSMREGVFVLDAEQRIRSVNPAFAAITQLNADSLTGRRWQDAPAGELGTRLAEAVAQMGRSRSWQGEVDAQIVPGRPIACWLTLSMLAGDSLGQRTVGILTDVSALRAAEARAEYQAHHDALTGLPNRRMLIDRLDHAIARAERGRGSFALLSIGLDLHDRLDEDTPIAVRDAVLREVAQRFTRVVRSADTLARVEGDIFLIIAECPERRTDAARLAERLLAVLAQPVRAGHTNIALQARLGIAQYPDDGVARDAMLRAADAAMLSVAAGSTSRYAMFTAEMPLRVAAPASSRPTAELQRALDQGELRLHYQPQIDLASGRTVAFEALLRWQHPERGLLGPEHVIPLAEESGLIVPIGRWVLREAVRQTRAWQDEGLGEVRMAVNVSPAQLRDGDLVDVLREALQTHGIEARLIELEVTESALQSNCGAVLAQLKALGASVALDDFGTGYSGLSSMKHLPLARCKIDRAFVKGLPGNGQDAAIASAIVTLSHHLGLTVTAEGVETAEQADFLRALGCDEVQGFLYGRPVPPRDAAHKHRAELQAQRAGTADQA